MKIARLSDRIEALESQLWIGRTPSRGSGNWLAPSPGFIGGFEQLFIRHQHSEPDETTNKSFRSTQRISLGWMNGAGSYVQIRYFDYPSTTFDYDESVEATTFDAEYGGRFKLGNNFAGSLSGGLRFSRYDDQDLDYDDSIGPLLGAEIRSQLSGSFALYGLLRHSIQFGNSPQRSLFSMGEEVPGSYGITDMQVGVEIQRRFQTCGNAPFGFVRCGLETQQWSGMADEDSEDISLIGFSITVGLSR
ncbi:hypothetical protein [Roseiconus lacunae]|uniref:hypothetical protein n=1 Tax=Roseiconus lacunae TaxID=2605694 RepID=UPI001E4AB5C6|nr:hypothetical protein [Roseiconus lacunae]MCD0457913.1 hypothetical protein [Roseiconus lacunae]